VEAAPEVRNSIVEDFMRALMRIKGSHRVVLSKMQLHFHVAPLRRCDGNEMDGRRHSRCEPRRASQMPIVDMRQSKEVETQA
jgi:diadenosine tetraphosphate (Ap4A) HIT family hydrolase